MAKKKVDLALETATPNYHLGELMYLGFVSLLLLGLGGYHWKYQVDVAATLEKQNELIAQVQKKNEIYEKFSQNLASLMTVKK